MEADDALAVILADYMAAADDARPSRSAPSAAVTPDTTLRPDLRAMLAEQCAADPARLNWPDDWFDYTDSGQIAACRALWGAALLACIRSALGAIGANDAKNTRTVSLSWFQTKDFHTMCALAGFDGVALADRLTDPARVAEIAKRLEPVRGPQRGQRGVA
jgi:hypothetical protein